MIKRLRTDPLWLLFCKDKPSNILLTSLTLLFNLISASVEGVSFAFILFSFNILSGDLPAFLQSGPLRGVFSTFDKTQLFSLMMFGAILSQVFRSLFAYFGQLFAAKLTVNLQSDAQRTIYQRIFNMPFATVNRFKVGDLIAYATAPPNYFRNLIDWTNRLIVSLMMIASYILFMIKLSFSLTLLILTLFCLSALVQKILINKIMQSSKSQTDHLVELNKETAQNLSGLRTIHLFERRGFVLNNIKKMLKNIGTSSIRMNKWINLILPVNEVLAVVMVGTTMISGLMLLKNTHTDTFAVLLTFLALTYRLGMRLQQVMSGCAEIASNIGPIKRLREILLVRDMESSNIVGKPEIHFEKKICFENIFFTYPGKTKPALQEISFHIEKGTTLAFVGSSGGGKSTLLDLLLRLYEPTSGQITVDNTPLPDFNLHSWRELIGVVSQDVFLFHESIEENIRFGKLDATDEEVVEAAKFAGAHTFIENLPEGYRTTVGEKGYKLSGGEKQRISLARALVRNPEILVLDEATSNLDSESERVIQEALEKLRGKITVFVVAHRLATINMADQIVLLEHGRIVEQGTHEDLVAVKGKYHYLWSLQISQNQSSYELLGI